VSHLAKSPTKIGLFSESRIYTGSTNLRGHAAVVSHLGESPPKIGLLLKRAPHTLLQYPYEKTRSRSVSFSKEPCKNRVVLEKEPFIHSCSTHSRAAAAAARGNPCMSRRAVVAESERHESNGATASRRATSKASAADRKSRDLIKTSSVQLKKDYTNEKEREREKERKRERDRREAGGRGEKREGLKENEGKGLGGERGRE